MAPAIRIRGARVSAPSGYIVGRLSAGSGELEFLSPNALVSHANWKQSITNVIIQSGIVPVGANPTATAGPAAVNGSATTFMRSDAAPAVQLGSASQKGIVQVDGVTITSTGGIISAVPQISPCAPLVNGDTLGPALMADGQGMTIVVPFGALRPDTRIGAYLACGLAASRPATPNIAPGASAMYYATDTVQASMWTGSAWHNVS